MRAKRWGAWLLATALVLTLDGVVARTGRAGETMPDACAVPDEIDHVSYPLPRLAEKIRTRQPLRILVVGSSSSVQKAPTSSYVVYSSRLKAILEERLPGQTVEMFNRAAPRQTAEAVVATLEHDVLGLHPDLAVWETGTTDGIVGLDIGAFGQALDEGVAVLRAHGVEAVFIDSQYSLQTGMLYNFEPYVESIQQIADASDMNVLRRHDIMHYYEESGRFAPDVATPAEQMRNANFVHGCLARLLADTILRAVALAGE